MRRPRHLARQHLWAALRGPEGWEPAQPQKRVLALQDQQSGRLVPLDLPAVPPGVRQPHALLPLQTGSCIRGEKCPYAHNVFE